MEELNFNLCYVQDQTFYGYNKTNEAWSNNNSTVENNFSGDVILKNNKIVGFGTVVGVCVTLLINTSFAHEVKKLTNQRLNVKLKELVCSKSIYRTIILIFVLLVSPFIFLVLLSTFIYKMSCSIIIKRKDKNFVRYLDSFDVFWSLEDDASKSIISVLGVIESNSAYELARKIKDKLENILPSEATEKIFYRRNEEFGFYYWRKYSDVDMEQYVQIVDHPSKDELMMTDLQNIMTDLANKALPYEDEGLFQILITKQRIQKRRNEKGEYGIVFRIHHAVGDGVALIEFLCKTLADENDSCLKMFSNTDSCNINYSSPADLTNMMRKLIEMPLCFVDGIIRQSDDNSLHGPSLNGKKIFAWTESDESLLQSVKDIKNHLESWRFTDILAAALAHGLHLFFSKKVAVVLPVRCPKTTTDDADIKLENDFSVTILDLPIKREKHVENIKSKCDDLRRSADPLTNYLFLKLVAGVLPNRILKPLLNSSQATMVFSNMPGPDTLRLCGGNVLKDLVFFVPHRGTTGLGITALCYGGVLRFGAMADEALVSKSEDLAIILQGMVEEVECLHSLYVK